MEYYDQLISFISVANKQTKGKGVTEDAKIFHDKRIREYRNLKVEIRFGIGRASGIPWISFLGPNQTIQNGIYPVFLFYKEKNILILSYGVSEKNKPLLNWRLPDLKTISNYFKSNNLGKPEHYGNSYVYKAYHLNKDLNKEEINEDLNNLIEEYKNILSSTHQTLILESQIDKKEISFNYRSFHKKINEANLKFSQKMIVRFIASLCTKPFVICSGLSGSGKTKLAQSFVQWISERDDQYKIVPVGADWTNREPLLGYPNALNSEEYVSPDNGVLDLILNATKNAHLPYFLILDEMNLSHVERYFADFLSAMESKDYISLHGDKIRKSSSGTLIPNRILIPQNFFVIGTVNIDETTYMFSPKVLDRANAIEFRITNLEIEEYLNDQGILNMNVFTNNNTNSGVGSEMAVDFLKISKANYPDNVVPTKNILLDFFKELRKSGAEFGFRSASEINRLVAILDFLTKEDYQWDGVDVNAEHDFIDIAILQKLLPKLHGSRTKLNTILTTLAKFCIESGIKDFQNRDEDFRKVYFIAEDSISFEKKASIIYPLSFEKIARMHKNAIDNGFTSYAEA